MEMQGCILSTVATDALVLKHQAIGIHTADKIFIVSEWFHREISCNIGNVIRKSNYIKKKRNKKKTIPLFTA